MVDMDYLLLPILGIIDKCNTLLLSTNLVSSPSPLALSLTQWQNSSILTHGMLNSSLSLTSMNDLHMEFTSNPELSFTNTGLVLPYNISSQMFAPYVPGTHGTLTLLNPITMYEFYNDYYFRPD
jgi:hypothetical protein